MALKALQKDARYSSTYLVSFASALPVFADLRVECTTVSVQSHPRISTVGTRVTDSLLWVTKSPEQVVSQFSDIQPYHATDATDRPGDADASDNEFDGVCRSGEVSNKSFETHSSCTSESKARANDSFYLGVKKSSRLGNAYARDARDRSICAGCKLFDDSTSLVEGQDFSAIHITHGGDAGGELLFTCCFA